MEQRSGAERLKRFYDRLGVITALIGLAVSAYGLYVELMLDKHGTSYEPMCDINSVVSCSKALHSRFAIGLGLVEPVLGAEHILNQKNALYGVLVYAVMVPLQTVGSGWAVTVTLAMSLFMNALSIYLFFVLVYLRVICIVCFTIYAINAILLAVNMKRRRISDLLLGKKKA
ncbi:unnamed protein product [Toxocara canis]|nr:unnamed protein product [Toxocara canis]